MPYINDIVPTINSNKSDLDTEITDLKVRILSSFPNIDWSCKVPAKQLNQLTDNNFVDIYLSEKFVEVAKLNGATFYGPVESTVGPPVSDNELVRRVDFETMVGEAIGIPQVTQVIRQSNKLIVVWFTHTMIGTGGQIFVNDVLKNPIRVDIVGRSIEYNFSEGFLETADICFFHAEGAGLTESTGTNALPETLRCVLKYGTEIEHMEIIDPFRVLVRFTNGIVNHPAFRFYSETGSVQEIFVQNTESTSNTVIFEFPSATFLRQGSPSTRRGLFIGSDQKVILEHEAGAGATSAQGVDFGDVSESVRAPSVTDRSVSVVSAEVLNVLVLQVVFTKGVLNPENAVITIDGVVAVPSTVTVSGILDTTINYNFAVPTLMGDGKKVRYSNEYGSGMTSLWGDLFPVEDFVMNVANG